MVSRLGMAPTTAPLSANDQLRENVRELLRFRRINQATLADALGVSQPWVSKRLTGTTPFQIEDLDAIAKAFDLSPSDLLRPGHGHYERRSGTDRRSGEDRRRS